MVTLSLFGYQAAACRGSRADRSGPLRLRLCGGTQCGPTMGKYQALSPCHGQGWDRNGDEDEDWDRCQGLALCPCLQSLPSAAT